jgi:hypothetical protein
VAGRAFRRQSRFRRDFKAADRPVAGSAWRTPGLAEEDKHLPIDVTKLMSGVGQRTKMVYPGSEGTRHGILKSRVPMRPHQGVTGAEYCTVVDVIEFEGHPELWLRVGYYRQAAGSEVTRWASQTAWCGPFSEWLEVLPVIIKSMEKDGRRAGMRVRIVLPFRAEGTGTSAGVAEKTFELPELPFDYPVTVRLGRTELTPSLRSVTWDDRDGLTIRMEERRLNLRAMEIPKTPDQILWEDIQEEQERQVEDGWRVTRRP